MQVSRLSLRINTDKPGWGLESLKKFLTSVVVVTAPAGGCQLAARRRAQRVAGKRVEPPDGRSPTAWISRWCIVGMLSGECRRRAVSRLLTGVAAFLDTRRHAPAGATGRVFHNFRRLEFRVFISWAIDQWALRQWAKVPRNWSTSRLSSGSSASISSILRQLCKTVV